MEEFINLIVSNLSEIIITALIGVVSYVLTTIGSKVKKWLDDQRIANFAEDTVKCINQAYETFTNEEKYEKAKQDIIEWVESEGLRITESKIKILIESAVANNKKNKENKNGKRI